MGKEDAAFAGGKGASLGEMTQAGIPVPPGFVLLAGAFEKFLDEANLNSEVDSILSSVDTEAMHTVDGASAKIQALILGAKMPTDIERAIRTEFAKLDTEYVAVRSSATAEDSASASRTRDWRIRQVLREGGEGVGRRTICASAGSCVNNRAGFQQDPRPFLCPQACLTARGRGSIL